MTKKMLLDPGFELTLRPMRYPQFYDMYRDAIKNTWTVDEINFQLDISDLHDKMTPADRHLIHRLVAFFATGDSIVSNNLVLNLYQHLNSPEARMYLSRQLYEEALHVQFYLTLLDNYLPDPEQRNAAFAAVENIPSIKKKADFCFKWIDSIQDLHKLETREHRRQFLLNQICFAAIIEGLFFFAAFAYVYYFRSRGLLSGLASGTNWVFRDESCGPLDSTEILTDKGFVSLREVVTQGQMGVDTKVAQYTSDGRVEFVTPRGYVRKHFNGNLIHCRTDKSVSLLTTPDHDNVTRSKTTGELRKTKAPDMSLSSTSEMVCAGFGVGPAAALTDIERFAIAYQADGTERIKGNGTRVGTVGILFGFAKERKIQRFEALLDRLRWDYSKVISSRENERNDQVVYRVKMPASLMAIIDKDFSWVTMDRIHSNWAREFIEEVSHWDSYLAEDRTCVQYINTNEDAVNKVQAVAALAGYATNLYRKTDGRSDSYNDVYNLFIKQRDYADLHKAELVEVPFTGEVGCVNVPSGMIFFRQDGKVHVTGNCHMNFAFESVRVIREEEPDLFDAEMEAQVYQMLEEGIECELQFAEDVLSGGVAGISTNDMRQYLQHCADNHFLRLGMKKKYNVSNPLPFMELQDVQELTNFFERRVSAYQVGVQGEVAFDMNF